MSRSGLVQNGYGFPVHSTHKKSIDPAAVNLHLLPNNTNSSDNGTAFCVIKSDRNSKYTVQIPLQVLVHGIQWVSLVYMYLLSTSPSPQDTGLNPLLRLLPSSSFTGHPSYQLLSETMRNQLFAMPRPSFRATPQQQFTEKEWSVHTENLFPILLLQ